MSTSGQVTLQVSLAVFFVITTAYSAGRVHQWYRRTFERDVAYREGYDQASSTLFALAARKPAAKEKRDLSGSASQVGRSAPIRGSASFRVLDRQSSRAGWPVPVRSSDTDSQRG